MEVCERRGEVRWTNWGEGGGGLVPNEGEQLIWVDG